LLFKLVVAKGRFGVDERSINLAGVAGWRFRS
jgi:hypothetical protein